MLTFVWMAGSQFQVTHFFNSVSGCDWWEPPNNAYMDKLLLDKLEPVIKLKSQIGHGLLFDIYVALAWSHSWTLVR